MSLSGKIAVITGAAGAIGSATAGELARRGAQIVAVDLAGADFSLLHAAMDGLPAPLVVGADVTSEADVRAYVEQTVAAHGRIDVFFNNAGIEGAQVPLVDYPVAIFRRVLDVNVVGVFLGLQAVLPVMLTQRSGTIINASSIGGLVGAAHMSAYIASKHAVLGLTKVAALEAASAGVRVNAVHPGLIDSRMLSDIGSGTGVSRNDMAGAIPAGRLGTPGDVARAVAFLAGDDSGYMNGSSLVIDGGLIVQ